MGIARALSAIRGHRSTHFHYGMPRSGSTFLHELLAEDPANRAPRVWEVMFPLGIDNESTASVDRRVQKAGACLWRFRRLAPGADSVYPMRARMPHECVAIAIEGMRALAAGRSRYRKPAVNPTLACFGLDRAAEAERFGGYCARFGNPSL